MRGQVCTPASVTTPLEVTDDPCWVLLSSTGLLARTSTADPVPSEGGRAKHDAVEKARASAPDLAAWLETVPDAVNSGDVYALSA